MNMIFLYNDNKLHMLFQLILFSFCVLGNCLNFTTSKNVDNQSNNTNTFLTLPNYHNDSYNSTCNCQFQSNQNNKNISTCLEFVGVFVLTTLFTALFVNLIGDIFIALLMMAMFILLLLIFIVAN